MLIFEYKIPDNKRLDLCLQKCVGFGITSGSLLLSKFGINLKYKENKINKIKKKFLKKLPLRIINKTTNLLKLCVGVDRKNKILFEYKKIRESSTLKALRHYQRLPTRGQRTRTNARTQKSKRGSRKNLPIPAKKKV